jgi:hypothetical protein
VAHAFKVMERALPLLSPDSPPERREIQIETSFTGPGARDGFELVTRAVTGLGYIVDPGLARPERGPTLERYVFILRYRGAAVTLVIRDGYVTDEFIALARKEGRSPEEEIRLGVLKQEMADRLLPSRPSTSTTWSEQSHVTSQGVPHASACRVCASARSAEQGPASPQLQRTPTGRSGADPPPLKGARCCISKSPDGPPIDEDAVFGPPRDGIGVLLGQHRGPKPGGRHSHHQHRLLATHQPTFVMRFCGPGATDGVAVK